MLKDMKVKFSRTFLFGVGKDELNHNTPFVCKFSKWRNSNILRTFRFLKLKPTGLAVGDVELTKRKYLISNVTASTHTAIPATIITTSTATTVTKAKATTIYSTTNAATKTINIKAKNLGNIEAIRN